MAEPKPDVPAAPTPDAKRQMTYRLLLPDSVRGLVTYIIVLAGIGCFIYAAFWTGDEKATNSVIAFFSTLLGTVLGFFFGARGTDKAIQAATLAEEGKKQATDVAFNAKGRIVEEAKQAAEYERFLALVASKNDSELGRKVEDILEEMERAS